MKSITNLSTIISHYDAILMDLWGVVHDGSHLYSGVLEALTGLKKAKKKVIMISNAPRRASKAVKVLTQLGVTPDLYECAVTSGEMGYRALHTDTSWGRRYYYVGPPKDADVLDGLEYQRIDDVKSADFLLNVGFGSEEESSGNWQMLLRAAHGLKLPMLCLNPDFEVVKITGERYACAGVLAADYERMGGTVKYFGKPFPEVYEYCLELLKPVEKTRILAIGDGIATDIAGAVNFGIDAALVTGGIIKKDAHRVEELCQKLNAIPNYVMPALVW